MRGDAKQGSDAYARDHLLTDPRFAQFFHDHPRLWEDIKTGDTQLHYRVISTRTRTAHPTSRTFPLTWLGTTAGRCAATCSG